MNGLLSRVYIYIYTQATRNCTQHNQISPPLSGACDTVQDLKLFFVGLRYIISSFKSNGV